MLKSNVNLAIKLAINTKTFTQTTNQLAKHRELQRELVLASGISSAKAESKPRLLKNSF